MAAKQRKDKIDPLTGLMVRVRFEQELARAAARARKQGGAVSVGVVDVDLFGQVNEAHGREAGNALLVALAAALSEAFGGDCRVGRIGGDGMAVLWPELEKEQAFLRLEAFRASFAQPRVVAGGGGPVELTPSVSAGLAACPDDDTDGAALLVKACEALYRAKVSGRNKVCLAREERMVTKTSHYTQGQLLGLRRLSEREGFGEAVLLREALNDLLRKYNA